ncbi:hypothetical protein EMN47_12170 [Prolixibacteraceae bacterium JC049]|nr:hypothetical protein [Prolixibacteraceae bacterium JC049]
MKQLKQLFYLLILCSFISCGKQFTENKRIELGSAEIIVKGNQLIANTGIVVREWNLTSLGLKTTSFKTEQSHEIIDNKEGTCDWSFNWMNNEQNVILKNVELKKSNDQGFTSEYIQAQIEFEYPTSGIGLKYQVWVYPNAKGVRTQLFLKRLGNKGDISHLALGVVEKLEAISNFQNLNFIGYYNDTQHRNKAKTPILKKEKGKLEDGENNDWANILHASNDKSGVLLIKESHKCVNQKGVNTGGFRLKNNTLEVYGAGLDANFLNENYQSCWANWSIVYDGDKKNAEVALKQFDRLRYPIDPNRDIYIMSNTWGTGDSGANSRYASREENILREIDSAKDLGIDLLQIDDGWQGVTHNNWRPVKELTYKNKQKGTQQHLINGTKYKVYPNGWQTVKNYAAKNDVKLGLWAASWIPLEDLKWNYQQGGFSSYKLDFAYLDTYKKLNNFENKVRKFVLSTGNKVRVNWDVTENNPRIGYFYGREYGNIYLENRKPELPVNVIYQPWLVLRDAWQVAKYINLNKFQVTYQNIDRVDKAQSDAYMHSHSYCLAITLMGSPIFFQETQLLNDNARKEIKPLIKAYKAVRKEMFKGYVYAIGQKPNNSGWTGFQNCVSNNSNGFLTIFRERLNQQNSKQLKLKFLKNCGLKLTNLLTKETTMTDVDEHGFITINIEKSGDYRFYKYQIIEK